MSCTDCDLTAWLELRESERRTVLGSTISSLGHELGTPLNIIVGRATMIAEAQIPADQVREHALMMAEQARRIAQAFQRWRMHSEAPSLTREPLNTAALAGHAVAVMGPLADRHQVRLTLPDIVGVPPAGRGDPERVIHALVEVVRNAIEASPRGGKVTLTFGETEVSRRPDQLAAPGRFAWIAVSDEGPGLPEADRQRIFEPFFTTRGDGRLGLGLTLARHEIRRLGGWIDARPANGRGGAAVVIHLPM